MFLDALSPYLNNKTLRFWQIACDGLWEEACKIQPQSDERIKIKHYIDKSDNIALEAFFYDTDDDEFFFFGIRLQNLTKEQRENLILKLTHSIKNKTPLTTVKTQTQELLAYNEWLDTPPDFLEIGAEGFWKTYGSYQLWDKNSEHNIATAQDIETNAPQILQPFKRPMMVECAWREPLPVWLGIQVSEKQNDIYQFSYKRYKDLISLISNT